MQFFALLNGRPTIFQGLYLKGSAAAPSIAFADSPGSGIWLVDPANIGISIAGSQIYQLNSSGEIYGPNLAAYLRLNSNGRIHLVSFGTNQDIYIQPSGTGRLRIAQSIVSPTYTNNYGLTVNDQADTKNVSLGVATNYAFLQSFNSTPLAINPGGNVVLFGKEINSANGFIQLADHTTTAGGIGFGTDVSIYRQSAGQLQIEHIGGTNPQLKFAIAGTTRGYLRADPIGNTVINATSTGALYLNFDNGTGGTIFCNGAGGTVGSVSALGISSFTGANHTFGSSASAGTSLKVISGVGTIASPKYSALDFRTYNDSDSGAYIRTGNRQSDTNEWILEFAARSNGNVLTQVASFGAAGNSFLTLLTTAASATASAGFRIPHGAAPTAPVNGDIWTTTAGLYVRINGATVGPLT